MSITKYQIESNIRNEQANRRCNDTNDELMSSLLNINISLKWKMRQVVSGKQSDKSTNKWTHQRCHLSSNTTTFAGKSQINGFNKNDESGKLYTQCRIFSMAWDKVQPLNVLHTGTVKICFFPDSGYQISHNVCTNWSQIHIKHYQTRHIYKKHNHKKGYCTPTWENQKTLCTQSLYNQDEENTCLNWQTLAI